jgi:secondary thiamine-phosphate synthase enzyme
MSTTMSIAKELGLRVHHEVIRLETSRCLEFIDITEHVRERVRSSGVHDGLVNVQTRHTTTAIMVGEHEPLLLEDLSAALEKLAPSNCGYRHDDFTVRTVNMCPDEQKNGHSHCKALFLRSSETLNVVDGSMDLGAWQRIFLIELDRPRPRTVSVVVLGVEI